MTLLALILSMLIHSHWIYLTNDIFTNEEVKHYHFSHTMGEKDRPCLLQGSIYLILKKVNRKCVG